MPLARQSDFQKLRGQFPYFEYQSYQVSQDKNGLLFSYKFSLAGKYFFSPSVYFQSHPLFSLPNTIALSTLAFHIGLIELISYWKTACPPLIIIQPHSLSEDEVSFWKNLYWNGLGEFFHLNGINTNIDDFVSIESYNTTSLDKFTVQASNERVLVPIGGGKDSAVSLELLANSQCDVVPFMLNPIPAMLRTIHAAGIDESRTLIVNRRLDPVLLQLNNEGFLNGHTPFSALLAFVTVTAATLTQSKHVALSNESSANEATIPGTHINHQYSKTLHFENAFRTYLASYITPDINYFSFLRPLNELQIAWLFSRMPQYHSAFRSCNSGSKTDIWCGVCPKCLFTFTILSPFLNRTELVRIFGDDLYANKKLLSLLESLAGLTAEKPFECVGTTNEVSAVLDYLNQCNHNINAGLPVMLKNKTSPHLSFDALLRNFDTHHFLTPYFETLLRNSLND
jgi:hypothetical protein